MKKSLLSLFAIILIATNIHAQIPTNGLVAYYPFTGNANDSSGNVNNGTVNGATLTTDRFGRANSAYSFNGTNQRIDIASKSTLSFPNAIFSYSYWAKINPSNNGFILCKYNVTSNFEYNCYSRFATNRLSFGALNLNGTCGPFGNDTSVTSYYNQWHHFVFVGNGTNGSKIYIDGKFIQSTNYSSCTMGAGTGKLYIGMGGGWNEQAYFNGSIDDIGFWNRALDSTEVRLLYGQSSQNSSSAYSQKWIKVIDSASTLSNAFPGFAFSSNFCNNGGWTYKQNSITLSSGGTKLSLVGTQQNGSCNIYTTTLNTNNGSLNWKYGFNNTGTNQGSNIAYDTAGNLIVSGALNVTGSPTYLFSKFNSVGSNILNKNLPNLSNNPQMTIVEGNKIIVKGFIYNNPTFTSYFPTYAYDTSGNLLWVDTFKTSDYWYGYIGEFTIDKNQNIITTGLSQTNTSNPNTYQIVIDKLNSSGNLLWNKSYRSPNNVASYLSNFTICTDNSNNVFFLVCGGAEAQYLRLVKLDGNTGVVIKDTLLYSVAYNQAKIFVNTNGNIVVEYNDSGKGFQVFDGNTFKLLWTNNIPTINPNTFDINGNLFATDNNKIKIYSPVGNLIDSFLISVNNYGNIALGQIVIDNQNNCFYASGNVFNATSTKMFVAKFARQDSSQTLPLHLTTFTATYQNKQSALRWSSTNETNTANFVVERSSNGSSFSQVGVVTAKGSGNNSYGFTDGAPSEASILYYRLKMIDKEGSYTYSQTVQVVIPSNTQGISLAPNPANNSTTVYFKQGVGVSVGVGTVSVYNALGEKVLTQEIGGAVRNSFVLPTASLQAGTYIVNVKTATGTYSSKLQIVR